MEKKVNLSLTKQALLEKWWRGTVAVGDLTTIPQRPRNSPLQLSFPQQRQLFLELLEPGTAVNNLSICLELTGTLDRATLTESANRILARHEVLRTSFLMNKGLPTPQPTLALTVALPLIDLQKLPEPEREAEAMRLARDEAMEPFDVTRAPLLRLVLFRLAQDRHILLVLAHHTISDGWSLGVFLRELAAFYTSIATGNPVDLRELPVQYADFAHGQRCRTEGDLLETQLAYWKQQLGGELPILELPLDHARSARQTFAGDTHHFQLARSLTWAIKEISRQEDVSLFMTLLAAFQVLLFRYSRQEDILVGTPIANRNYPEIEHLIGVFINTLVIRTDLTGNPTFREVLRRVRNVALAAYAHQDLPFERLVAELKPQRDLSRTPLFQAMFNLQRSILPTVKMPRLTVRPLPLNRGTSQFDLTFILVEQDGCLDGSVEYNCDLFETDTIVSISAAYQRLLEHAVACRDVPISQLRVLSEIERQHVITEVNQTTRDYPRARCMHELFEAQTERTPDNVAVIDERTSLTYGELDRRSSGLAMHLRQCAVGPEVFVGIYMHRSVEMVIGLLGILKAGGAYVPINPTDPPDRVTFMLTDASVRVLLTCRGVEPPRTDAVVVCVDGDAEFPNGEETDGTTRTKVTPDNAAYVIYTSGSTGRPKGVLVSHRALTNFLWSMAERPGCAQGEVLLAVTSLSFDIAALELYLPLIVGGTVVVASEEITRDPQQLGQALIDHNVDTMQATPASWRMMLAAGWQGKPGLKVLCGGDTLPRDLADQLLTRVGALWHLYGPTETTVWSAVCKMEQGDAVTIGTPIANTQLYVLDDYLHPVPTGVRGELYIGGDGLARGYLNRDDLTAEKFVSNPFTSSPNDTDRVFRTGDQARYLPDGRIELLGRLDDQVKIQGFRIEPGEVEATLIQHPLVREAVVLAREDTSTDLRLVAYFVPTQGPAPTTSDLRDFLKTILPAYMVPARFVPLEQLPLTPNGKIDRRALPVPEPTRPALSDAFVAPRNPLEQRLCSMYAQVLGIDQIGIHDNFFDLGGGSLQILEIIVHAQEAELMLTPQLFFEYQTVATLAATLNTRRTELLDSPSGS